VSNAKTIYKYEDPRYLNTEIVQTRDGLADKKVEFTYDAAGLNTVVERYVDGLLKLTTTNAYDVYGRLTGISHVNGAGVVASSSYVIDDLDRLTSETIDGQSRTIGYDSIDQVATVTGSNTEAYTYDKNGNRTNAGYSTGADNRLLLDGVYSYVYDAEGNRIRRTELATGIRDNYTWDYRNRLEGIVTKDANGATIRTVGYEYDVDDQRVRKTVDGVVENYFIDRNQIAFVTDGNGNETFHYLYGLDVDRVLAQDSSAAGMVWALADRLGSIDTITDEDGVVVDKRTFDTFGRVLDQTNPSVSFRYGYTGRELDLESGLHYYRARYYDSNVGRFISVDPLGFDGGDTNLYRYVGNSSTLATDPTGMFSLQEAWNNGVNFAQNIWNGGVNNVQQAVNKVQQSVNNAGQAIVNGSVSFRNAVTTNAQAGLEYWSKVAVAGQNEGGIIGGAKQVIGTTFGLLSALATEDNIDKTNETLASVFGGSLLSGGARAIAGLQQTKNIATAIAATRVAKAVTPFITTVAPWVNGTAKAVAAFTGGYQGGVQLRQAWTGEGADGRQLSAPERFVAGVNGIATIATTFLSLKPQCFVAGTEIQTIDGTKNIEDIQVGDWVLSDDPNTVGEIEYKQVLNTFVKQTSSLIDVYIDGEKITTTEEHPFWVPDVGWVAAKDLHAGSYLQTKYESWLDVDLVVKRSDTATVYNFEVEGFHTYFVSDLGLLVHNTCRVKKLEQVPITGNSSKNLPIISTVSGDWGQKGAHIKIDGIEIKVKPGQDGAILFEPFFSSTSKADAKVAIKAAEIAIEDLGFRQRLYNANIRAIDLLKQGDQMSRGRAAELRFLMHALKKKGI
jgi:RHS repeat-associated protein